MQRETTVSRAQGRWRDILIALEFPLKALDGKAGPCPMCGGEDRFVFDNKDGRGGFFCRGCGPGNGVELVKRWKSVSFRDACKIVDDLIGRARVELPKARVTGEKAKSDRTELWLRARPLDGRDLASRYLRSRGLSWNALNLRFIDDLPYKDHGSHPAMLARFAAPDAKSATIHRTWLAEPGRKADLNPPRKMMPGEIPAGGAVRLSLPEATMGVAEGIETALAAEAIHNLPVWATTSAGAMVKFKPPQECKQLVIFADQDANFAGQQAAYALAYRLRTEVKLTVIKVMTPWWVDEGDVNRDWNDVLLAEQRMAA